MPNSERFFLFDYLPPVESDHFADSHIAAAINYAAMDNPQEMESLLRGKIASLEKINDTIVADALLFIKEVHAGQQREYRGNVPFLVHPLGVALLTIDLFGKKLTTEQLVVALCHDTIEKGHLDGKQVIYKDVKEQFGEIIAQGVEGLSNINDKKDELDPETYCKKILEADKNYPQLKLPLIKTFADRFINYFDPVMTDLPPKARKTREMKIQDPFGPFTKILLEGKHYQDQREMVARACKISQSSLNPKFDIRGWAKQRMTQG